MRLRTYEDVAEAAGVSVDDVKRALEERYLVPGLITAYHDDRNLILNNWVCRWFVKYKGDTSRYDKWKGYYGSNITIGKWFVSVIRYRKAWVGIAIPPESDSISRYYTFTDKNRKIAFEMARKFAHKDERLNKSGSTSLKKGFAVQVVLTYWEMVEIQRTFYGSQSHANLVRKVIKGMERSIKRKERKYDGQSI